MVCDHFLRMVQRERSIIRKEKRASGSIHRRREEADAHGADARGRRTHKCRLEKQDRFFTLQYFQCVVTINGKGKKGKPYL